MIDNQIDYDKGVTRVWNQTLIRQKQATGQINLNKDKVEQGLARLVLTVIELIRRLMEKQAIRRMEQDSLTSEQIEELGLTLMSLEEKMQELKLLFGLKDEDLNINLGPFGDLM